MEITKEMLDLASANANHDQLRVMYDAMKADRDALAAQVEALRMAIMSNCYDDQSTSGRRLMELANKTPQQHLAEIRAQAGRAGYITGAIEWTFSQTELAFQIERASELYADNIKEGE